MLRGEERGVGEVIVLVIGSKTGQLESIDILPRAAYHTGVASCLENLIVRWSTAYTGFSNLQHDWADIFGIRAYGEIMWPCEIPSARR
jgi:hypothetical protein